MGRLVACPALPTRCYLKSVQNADKLMSKYYMEYRSNSFQLGGNKSFYFVTFLMVCCDSDIFASGKATKNPAFTLLIQEGNVGFGGHWNERKPWTNPNIKVITHHKSHITHHASQITNHKSQITNHKSHTYERFIIIIIIIII